MYIAFSLYLIPYSSSNKVNCYRYYNGRHKPIIPTGVKYPTICFSWSISGKLFHIAVANAPSIPVIVCHKTLIISIKIIITSFPNHFVGSFSLSPLVFHTPLCNQGMVAFFSFLLPYQLWCS